MARTNRQLPSLQAVRYSSLDHLVYVRWGDDDHGPLAAIPDGVVRERNSDALTTILRTLGLEVSDAAGPPLLEGLMRSIRRRLPEHDSRRLIAAN